MSKFKNGEKKYTTLTTMKASEFEGTALFGGDFRIKSYTKNGDTFYYLECKNTVLNMTLHQIAQAREEALKSKQGRNSGQQGRFGQRSGSQPEANNPFAANTRSF